VGSASLAFFRLLIAVWMQTSHHSAMDAGDMMPISRDAGKLMEVRQAAVPAADEKRMKQAKKGNKIMKATLASPDVIVQQREGSDVARLRPSQLGEDIERGLAKVAPSMKSTALAERCLLELQAIVRRIGPAWDVLPFGSFANGFGTVHSDLDATCCVPGQMLGYDTQQHAAWTLREWIVPMLQQHDRFSIKEQILGARVPIVKLIFENRLEVDLSCHNVQPLLNTRLLKAYADIDARIKHLGVAVKLWAKGAQVCDACRANLSSYAFTLLVIYFLQVHPDVQLPVLPVDAFCAYERDKSNALAHGRLAVYSTALAEWRSGCNLSVPELLARFFAFYSNHDSKGFDWGREVASVRIGSRQLACDPIFSWLRGRHVSRLHVEDPYQLERNLHGVLGMAEEAQLQAAFGEAFQDMFVNQTPRGLKWISQTSTLPFAGEFAPDIVGIPEEKQQALAAHDDIVSGVAQKHKSKNSTNEYKAHFGQKVGLAPPLAENDLPAYQSSDTVYDAEDAVYRLCDMIQKHKAMNGMGNGAESTRSDCTTEAMISDEDNCAESSSEAEVHPNSAFVSVWQ